jgi:hypothetical protein
MKAFNLIAEDVKARMQGGVLQVVQGFDGSVTLLIVAGLLGGLALATYIRLVPVGVKG